MHSTTLFLSALGLLSTALAQMPGAPGAAAGPQQGAEQQGAAPGGAGGAGGAPGGAGGAGGAQGGSGGAGGQASGGQGAGGKSAKPKGGSGISIKLHPDGTGISIKHMSSDKGDGGVTIGARGLSGDFDDGLTIFGRSDMHEYFTRGLEHLLQSRWADPEPEPEAYPSPWAEAYPEAYPDPEAEAYEDFYYW